MGGLMKLFGDVSALQEPMSKVITFMPVDVSILLFALAEFVLGALLVLGLFTKTAAKLTALLTLVIILSGFYVGMAQMMMPNFGWLVIAWHLSNVGSNKLAVDNFFK